MIQIVRAGSVALAVLFASSPCLAQTGVENIGTLVKDGQKVSVTDDSGQVLTGRVGVITAEGLRIQGDGKSADVRFDRIVRIDRPNDSLANGALIGLGAGAALGLAAIAVDDPSAGSFYYVTSMLLGAGLGTAIGIGVDALIHHKREIYRRGDGTHVTAAPAFGHGVRGAVVSVTW